MVNLVRHHEDALAPEGELDADRWLVGGEGVPQLKVFCSLTEDHDGDLAVVHGAHVHQAVVLSGGEEVRGFDAFHGGPRSDTRGRHRRGDVQLSVPAADRQNLGRYSEMS